jgi:hypothetical protein
MKGQIAHGSIKRIAHMKLSQTLVGNWVITVESMEDADEHIELQLAEFDMTAVGKGSPAELALENAVAAAFAAIIQTGSVKSFFLHGLTPENTRRMREKINDLTSQMGVYSVPITAEEVA